MHDRTGIDEWIDRALAHTGLPMGRRAETAEEWRAHLDQLICDKRSAGMPDEQAVRAALEAFGRPEDLRRQLRHDRRMQDRRAALAEVRRGLPMLIIFAVALVVFLSAAVRPASIWAAVIGGLCFLVSMAVVMAMGTFFVGLLTMRIVRTRPRAEFAFFPRWGYWTVVSFVLSMAAVGLPTVMITPLYPILADLPHFRLGMMSFWQAYLSAMLEDLGGIRAYMAPFTIAAISLALTLYERSRCTGSREAPLSTE